jgi:HTH-type transcriptional regulator, glycine betaine synthesis regulator
MNSAKLEMVEAGGRTSLSFGLSRLFGQIYTYLYLSEEPQSLDEVAEALGVSKASVSIAARQLESWGAVRCVWRKGDRRDFYEAETDFRRLISEGLMSSFNKKLESARKQIQRSITLLEQDGSANGEKNFLKKRLAEAEARRARIEKLLNNPLVRKLL